MRQDAIHDRLAGILKAGRESAGMSQRQLAARLGINQATVSFVENGTQAVRVTEFVEWCDALGMNPEDTLMMARGRII